MENIAFKYASESTRAINRIIDLLICYFPFGFLKYGLAILQTALGSDTTNSLSFSTGTFVLLLMIVEFVYYLIFEVIFGKTIAKFITRTQVVDFSGRKPNFQKILLRTCCRFIPFDWFSFINNKTGWHDDFSETKVINM